MDLQISIRVCSGTEQSAVGGPSGDEGKERCTRDIGMVSIIVDNSARCIPFRAMALVPGNSLHPPSPPPRIIPSWKFLSRRHAYAQPLFSMVPGPFVFELLPTCLELYTNIPREYSVFLFVEKRNILYK